MYKLRFKVDNNVTYIIHKELDYLCTFTNLYKTKNKNVNYYKLFTLYKNIYKISNCKDHNILVSFYEIDEIDDPVNDPTCDPVNDSTCDSVNDPTCDPTCDPVNDPICDPTCDPTYNPVNIPTYDPVNIPTYDPVNIPTYDPKSELYKNIEEDLIYENKTLLGMYIINNKYYKYLKLMS
jgi:hypothetical protein